MNRQTIMLLEDNGDRVRQFASAVAQLSADYKLRVWRDATRMMAECHDELRELPQAAEAYATALAKDPQRGEWWYKLGRLYLDMGSRGQGNEALGKAMALGDKQDPPPYWLPDAYRLSGDVARSSNNRKLAVTLFKRYLKIAPDGALDRDDVRKLLRSWDVDLSED